MSKETKDEQRTAEQAAVLSKDLLERLPVTADGKRVFIGDTVYFENNDRRFWGEDEVIVIKIKGISLNDPPRYAEGDYVLMGDEWEGTNLECFGDKENVLSSNTNVMRSDENKKKGNH